MSALTEYQDALGREFVLTGDAVEKWSRDWSGIYQWTPLAVLRPANTAEVSAVVKIAAKLGHVIVAVSGMTGMSGGASADGCVMVSLDRLNQIEDIRPEARLAIVGAGVILSNLHDAVDPHDLVFPLTFGAKGSACIGGCLSTNAGGSNVVRYGNTRDLCLGLEAVMPDGSILNAMTELHKDNSGYNLKHLLIGAEGTLGIITRAVVKLVPKPKAYATAMVAVPSLSAALTVLNRVQAETGDKVEAFEFMPAEYLDKLNKLKPATRRIFDIDHEVNILLEIGSTIQAECTPSDDGTIPLDAQFETILGELLEEEILLDAVIAKNEAERREIWERREAAAEVQLATKPLVNNDIALPLDKVASFYDVVRGRVLAFLPDVSISTVAHLGDGNLHLVVSLGEHNVDRKNDVMSLVEEVVLEYGGSFSAEHGIGLSKIPSMQRRKDPVAVATMRAIKAALDPNNMMNPGKVIPPLD
ncbi:MAG: FAD-binding oxidoreductase [Paracoccaceae bacterium]|nr:FAD-binding oxidoreductase [Paracoccaceae bacterium]MDG2258707.1 FAD-binding oxidoreductase [Paracoccaceae bacterium]